MKKILLSVSLFVALVTTVSAQTSASAEATLEVVLQKAVSITLAKSTVTLTLSTVDDYNNGKVQSEAGHLRVSSASDFEISVKTADNELSGSGVETIASNFITVTPTVSIDETATARTLSTTEATIIEGKSGLNKSYDMKYEIPAASAAQLVGVTADTYSTRVTYLITPK